MTAPKLVEIPLGPFTTPTGHFKRKCNCVNWHPYGPKDDCKDCKGSGIHEGDYEPCQRATSEDDRIKPNTYYLVRTQHANDKDKSCWYAGRFSEQWYGWSFNAGSHTIQLDMIEGPIYEICD